MRGKSDTNVLRPTITTCIYYVLFCSIRPAARSYPTGSGPFAIVLVDLNRDGNVDFAVTNRGADSLSVRLGDGRGNFGPRADFLTGDDPVAIATSAVAWSLAKRSEDAHPARMRSTWLEGDRWRPACTW